MRIWWQWVWGLLLGCIAVAGSAQEPAELPPGAASVALAPSLSYLHDTDGELALSQARQRLADGEFQPLPQGREAFGFQPGAFWFHARVVNQHPEEQRWLLVQQYPLSDRIDIHAIYPDGRIVHRAGGDHLPFSARSVTHRHPNFLLDLPQDMSVDLFVRVASESSMQVPLHLYTMKAFMEQSHDGQLIIGLYYGILIALFFYNLVLWISLRDASYFWYLFHIGAFGMVLFSLNGLGFEHLWPESPWLADHAIPLSICLALIGMQQFARIFLGLAARWPLGNRISLGIIAFFVLLGVASLWLPYRLSTPIASRAVLLGVLWIAIASIVVLRRGYAPARLFLLAWAMFLLGTTIFTLLAFGVLPKTFLTEYGVQIGSALEMLLLSVALSYRYAELRNENQRIIHEANQELERKVDQRTREVSQALTQLEQAHSRLRDSSRRDGLTGLYNRSYFQERVDQLLATCRSGRRPLSLLMLDLDLFKSVNDEYGHMVGDDCLRWAAHRIGKPLRAHDSAVLARFGGEEFVIALPGYDLHSAVTIAEEIRQSLIGEPFLARERALRVSVSVGVHTVTPDASDDADDAFEIADKALYAAKANGRNCVRTSISAA